MTKSILGVLVGLLVVSTPSGSLRGQTSPPERVWFWFATCGGPLMTLELRSGDSPIYKTTFPVCRAERDSASQQGQHGRIELTWRADRAITWEGYREKSERTTPNTPLEVDIWQAGADANWLTLGVSVVAGDRILMNTVHIAHPDRRDDSGVASGFTVRTSPSTK